MFNVERNAVCVKQIVNLNIVHWSVHPLKGTYSRPFLSDSTKRLQREKDVSYPQFSTNKKINLKKMTNRKTEGMSPGGKSARDGKGA